MTTDSDIYSDATRNCYDSVITLKDFKDTLKVCFSPYYLILYVMGKSLLLYLSAYVIHLNMWFHVFGGAGNAEILLSFFH